MTKDEFVKTLLDEGFLCEKDGQYPSVICDKKDVKKTARKVRAIAKEHGYCQSFAVRSFREGMVLVSSKGEGMSLTELLSADAEPVGTEDMENLKGTMDEPYANEKPSDGEVSQDSVTDTDILEDPLDGMEVIPSEPFDMMFPMFSGMQVF